MDKISIIVPVYKAEKVLHRCVDSILSQTYGNIELILVDDGSPDKSGEICDVYATADPRVRVFHQKNMGVAAARNSGLNLATGTYCAFVDSDDYIEPQMYQAMVDIAGQYHCDVVMCDCVKEFPDRTEMYTHDIRAGFYDREQLESEYFPHLLIMPNVEYPPTISNWTCLFKRNNIRYLEGVRFSEDLLFGAELLYHANSFYYMKGQCFYHYWMNPQSATHTFAADKWTDYLKLEQTISTKFSTVAKFDFSRQIDLVLLFFVYNAVGDIISTTQLTRREKQERCVLILHEERVRQMFSRMKIFCLPISWKLKAITLMYKHRIGINLLIARSECEK